ncbi:hypothetical protein RLIN73S_06180 [Rhodanobacter lindaniclasticus]
MRNATQHASVAQVTPVSRFEDMPRSYSPIATSRSLGRRYEGSSISSACSLLSRRMCFITQPTSIAPRMPARYSANSTMPCRLNTPNT